MARMKLERVEKGVRWAGALGIVVFMVSAYMGLWRGLRHGRGQKSGKAPDVLHTMRFYAPATVFGVALSYRLWRPLPVSLSRSARAAALLLGVPLFFAGLAVMLWGRFTLGKMYDISSSLGAQLYEDHELVTSGPFALVRHPMYVGGILWAAGTALIYRTWLALIMATTMPISLVIRARREEEALAAQFGEAWEAYRQRVPGWLPWRRPGA